MSYCKASTKFDFALGSTPYPAGGAYTALLYLDLRGPTSKQKKGRGNKGVTGWVVEGDGVDVAWPDI